LGGPPAENFNFGHLWSRLVIFGHVAILGSFVTNLSCGCPLRRAVIRTSSPPPTALNAAKPAGADVNENHHQMDARGEVAVLVPAKITGLPLFFLAL